MKYLVSVIVPIYNSQSTLERCIESILNQTYENIELILVNDGSSDNSKSICEYYKSLDSRVTVINKENEGVSATRNRGIKEAKGDLMGFVDSDDFIEKEMYETMVSRIAKDNSDACVLTPYSVNSFEKNKLNYSDDLITGKEAVNYLFKLEFPSSLWAYLYKKEVLKNEFLRNNLHFFEDFEYNFRFLYNAQKISLCHNKFYNYLVNDQSTNRQEINDKRITSLDIYDLIVDNFDKDTEPDILKNAEYFRSAFLINNILSLSSSYDTAEDKYFRIIKCNSTKILKDIFYSEVVPLKYKLSILSCTINIRITCRMLRVIRGKKDN